MKGKTKKTIQLHTGDGKILHVDAGICNISRLNEPIVHLENSSETSVQMVIDFYYAYSKFTDSQRKKWEDPMTFTTKIGKSTQSESDRKLVEPYNRYRKLLPKQFFELLETAWCMRVIPLVKMLAFITTSKIVTKTPEDIRESFGNRK